MRPWPGAPRRWPRRRPERGVSRFSLLRPNSAFDNTARVARSFASWASSVSTRLCDAFAARRRRDTSASRDSASFAARRASFACSTAAFSLRRDASKRDFHEPASQRATTSAQRNSSARACASSARARSRSARARSRSYGKRQSRGSRIGAASGKDRAPSSPATRVGAVSISSTRIAMGATIAHGGWRMALPVPF